MNTIFEKLQSTGIAKEILQMSIFAIFLIRLCNDSANLIKQYVAIVSFARAENFVEIDQRCYYPNVIVYFSYKLF